MKTFLAAAAATIALTGAAVAADLIVPAPAPVAVPVEPTPLQRWFVHAGPVGVVFDTSASVRAGGARIKGANLDTSNNIAAGLDIGYFVTPEIALALTLANPPRTTIKGEGAIKALGTIGRTNYLPPTVSAQYHYRGFGAFQPYVGAGVNYTMFFNEDGRALRRLKLDDSVGFSLQVGADMMLNQNWGVFVDAKKLWLSTTATGRLGAVPVKADVDLDPTLIHAGVTYRF